MTKEKYFFNNAWYVEHPTLNFFTFAAYCVEVFGHKCIIEHVQDGEIWSDEEYWGSVLYNFENDRYTNFSSYIDENYIEETLNKCAEINPDNVWYGKISKDFVNDKSRWAIDFYKSYISSNTELDFEDYYKKVYKLKENEQS